MRPLGVATAQTSWMDLRGKRIAMLGQAMSYLLEPLKEVAKCDFEIEAGGGEIRSCTQTKVFYCCKIVEAKRLSAVRPNLESDNLTLRAAAHMKIR